MSQGARSPFSHHTFSKEQGAGALIIGLGQRCPAAARYAFGANRLLEQHQFPGHDFGSGLQAAEIDAGTDQVAMIICPIPIS